MKTHCFSFNPDDNGGEALSLTTIFTDDDFCYHELTLSSYRNDATFVLDGDMITPEKLRMLADKLEGFFKESGIAI